MKAGNPIFIHYVHDMDRARDFYQSVFDVESSFESPGWSTLDFGTFELALHILEPGDEQTMPHAGLNLLVPEIEPMQASIEENGYSLLKINNAGG